MIARNCGCNAPYMTTAVVQIEPGDWFWGCYAAQREQARWVRSAPNKMLADFQIKRGGRFWGCDAAQREQARSPRGLCTTPLSLTERSFCGEGACSRWVRSAPNKMLADFQIKRGDRFWGCDAAQREQARSPQGLCTTPLSLTDATGAVLASPDSCAAAARATKSFPPMGLFSRYGVYFSTTQ